MSNSESLNFEVDVNKEKAEKKLKDFTKTIKILEKALKLLGKEIENSFGKNPKQFKKLVELLDKKSVALRNVTKDLRSFNTSYKKTNEISKEHIGLKNRENKVALSKLLTDKAIKKSLKEETQAIKKQGEAYDRASQSKLSYILQSAKTFALFGIYLKSVEAINFSVRELLTLEYNLVKVQNLFNGTTEEMRAFERGVRAISSATGKLSSEVADSLYQAISSGISPENSLSVVNTATRLAVAGATDTTTAMQGLVAVSNAYGLEVEEIDRLADKFFNTQKRGVVTIQELSNVVGEIAPITASVGISIDQMLGLLIETTKIIPNASKVANGWRQALINLVRPTIDAQKVAEDLKVEIGASALKYKGLHKVLLEIEEATQGDIALKSRIFSDVDGLKVVLAMEKSYGKLKDTVKELGEEFGQVDVSVKRVNRTLGSATKKLGVQLLNYFSLPKLPEDKALSTLNAELDSYEEGYEDLFEKGKITSKQLKELKRLIIETREDFKSLAEESYKKELRASRGASGVPHGFRVDNEVSDLAIQNILSKGGNAEVLQKRYNDLLDGSDNESILQALIQATDLFDRRAEISKKEFVDKIRSDLNKKLFEALGETGRTLDYDVDKLYDVAIEKEYERLKASIIKEEKKLQKELTESQKIDIRLNAISLIPIEDETNLKVLDRYRRFASQRESLGRTSHKQILKDIEIFLSKHKEILGEGYKKVEEIIKKSVEVPSLFDNVSLLTPEQEHLQEALNKYREYASALEQLGRDSYDQRLEDQRIFLEAHENALGESYSEFENIIRNSIDKQAGYIEGLSGALSSSLANSGLEYILDGIFGDNSSNEASGNSFSGGSSGGNNFFRDIIGSLGSFTLGFFGLERGGVVSPTSSGSQIGNLPVRAGEKGQAERVTVEPLNQFQDRGRMPNNITINVDGKAIAKAVLNNSQNVSRKGQG